MHAFGFMAKFEGLALVSGLEFGAQTNTESLELQAQSLPPQNAFGSACQPQGLRARCTFELVYGSTTQVGCNVEG